MSLETNRLGDKEKKYKETEEVSTSEDQLSQERVVCNISYVPKSRSSRSR